MLAQNFKTPADLDISDAEFSALVKVLGMFERGEIDRAEFDMMSWDCGTTACIVGWARRVGGENLFKCMTWAKAPRGLFQLVGGGSDDSVWCRQPAQAALALRSYLTTGEPRWAEALAE